MQDLIKEKIEYTKQDIVSLLKITDKTALNDLFELANNVRKKYAGNGVDLRGTIEFSNYCSKNCLFCGIRRSNEKIPRIRLEKEKIIEYAKLAEKMGYKTIILKSGEDCEYNIEAFLDIIKGVKSATKLSLTMAVGERAEIEYKMMKQAGADKYLINHETSDPILYRRLHPDLKYSNRIKCVRALKQLGFETGSGIVVGLPGQTFESLANDILLFKALELDFIDIDPYISHPDTPLSKKFDMIGGYFVPAIGYFDIEEMIHKIIAITRLVTKNTKIPVSTGIAGSDSKKAREFMLKCGANAFILPVTYPELRRYSDNYPKEISFSQNQKDSLKQIRAIVKALDLQIV